MPLFLLRIIFWLMCVATLCMMTGVTLCVISGTPTPIFKAFLLQFLMSAIWFLPAIFGTLAIRESLKRITIKPNEAFWNYFLIASGVVAWAPMLIASYLVYPALYKLVLNWKPINESAMAFILFFPAWAVSAVGLLGMLVYLIAKK